jgi:hypothetical protein
MILGLCDRFKKLPSEVLAEDAYLLRMVKVQELGRPGGTGEDVGEF